MVLSAFFARIGVFLEVLLPIALLIGLIALLCWSVSEFAVSRIVSAIIAAVGLVLACTMENRILFLIVGTIVMGFALMYTILDYEINAEANVFLIFGTLVKEETSSVIGSALGSFIISFLVCLAGNAWSFLIPIIAFVCIIIADIVTLVQGEPR